MIASLGMYDRPECQDATDRFWRLIRDRLRARGLRAPEGLVRGEAAYWQAWLSPDLVLSQTCGYPYRARLHGQVTLIGTPDYGVEGCPPGHYRSVFVARADDPRPGLQDFDGARFAYNEAMSHSGWAAPQTHAMARGLRLPPALCSGSHRQSAGAVAEGRADIAALDAVTWRLMRAHDPDLARALREVDVTDPTPGLPLIAAAGADQPVVLAAVAEAIGHLLPADRAMLGLRGIVFIPPERYLAVPTPPPPEQIAPTI